jgi:hypothetical protein
MKRIIELGDGPKLYARYNTNLSRVDYNGISLYRDLLSNIRDFQICASIDGTGQIGEYIRTGLAWPVFLENFRRGLEIARHCRQMRLDFTLTLPGLFEVENMQRTANGLGVDILAKVVFAFTPDIVMSPLALPRELLNRTVDRLIPATHGALKDVLLQLKSRPNFEEQWPDQYQAGLAKGKTRVLKLEQIRNDSFTMNDILSTDADIYRWWQDIRPDNH